MSQCRRNTHSLDQLQILKEELLATQRQAAAQAKREADQRDVAQQAQLANDPSIFRQALQGVQPLHSDIAPPRPKRPNKPDAQTLARRAAAMGHAEQQEGQMLSDTQAMLNPVASEAFLSYRQATLQHRVFEQLKTGKLRWYEAVDLHGCSIEEARIAVLQVIDMARQANQNVVKIVHGKGPQAILKTYVNGWLRQHRDVLAFVSALPEQGGTGAVLVLIRRAERQSS